MAAEVLVDGMLARSRLLDLLENFIVFDESRAGAVRKVVARNHQLLGVNRAVAAVVRQEALKAQFPPGERLRHRVVTIPLAEPSAADTQAMGEAANAPSSDALKSARSHQKGSRTALRPSPRTQPPQTRTRRPPGRRRFEKNAPNANSCQSTS